MKKFMMIVLLTVFAITIAGCSTTSAEGETFMSVDINPSIEFVLDENDEIISVKFSNEDAEIVGADIDFIGMHYEDALDALLNAAVETGYIDVESNDNNVIITVGNDNETQQNELNTNARETAQTYLEEHKIGGAVLNGEVVYDDLEAIADEYDISIGKARMIKSAQETDETLSTEELAEMPMEDLMDLITTAHREKMQAFADNKKQDALALKEEMKANAEAKVNQFRQQVEDGEVPTPNYEQIKTNHMADIESMMQQYQSRADNMRNGVIDDIDPGSYTPNTGNNPMS